MEKKHWRFTVADRKPTTAYLYDRVAVSIGRKKMLYKSYTNELDYLQPGHVSVGLEGNRRLWYFDVYLALMVGSHL